MRPQHYSNLQIGLHWLIALLLVVSWFSGDVMKLRPGESPGPGNALHVLAGLLILGLTVLRLAVRLGRGAPDEVPMPGWMRRGAAAAHWALYALLLAIPVTGMAAWFGGIEPAGEVHETLVNLGLLLVALHTAAALAHQFVLRDGLLARMRPGRR